MNQPKARALAPVAALGALLVALGPALAAPDAIAVDLSGAPVGRVHVQVDGTVTFRALAGEHEIAAEDGSWWTGRISEGTGATLRFEAVGEFPFVCLLHADEAGTVVVEPRQDEPPPPPVNAAPSARFLAPGDGATVTGTVPVRIGGEDPDGGPEAITMRVRVDGGAWMTVLAASANEWRFEWNAEAAGAGEHTIDAIASDGAAESAIATIRVRVDAPDPPPPPPENERPTVAITRPAANARLVPADVLVAGTAADADSPESALLVEISVDGGPWQRARGGTDWVFVWDAALAEPGPHTIAARASDEDSTSPVARLKVTISATGGFTPSTPAPPTGVESESHAWREAALDFGWVAIAVVALSGAWAWASSRP